MLSIFTPTYNRAYILHKLYNSLLKQTNKDFEWIIVDDGSTDNTGKMIKKWISEHRINIKYFYQENQGKTVAHNYGVEKATGELFTCVDSDDYLLENAVDVILKYYQKICDIKECVGMVGIRIHENGQTIGNPMPQKIEYSTLIDLYGKYKHKGDTFLIYKLDAIKKYSFPKIEGEKFIPETYLYDKIDQDGKLLVIKEALYVCEYLEDGYSKNVINLMKKNPKGYILFAEQRMNIAKRLKDKMKATVQYTLGKKLAKEKILTKKLVNNFWVIVLMPVSIYIYNIRYRSENNENRNNNFVR